MSLRRLKQLFIEQARTHIFIDADDTLWHDSKYFGELRRALFDACAQTTSPHTGEAVLETLKQNLAQLGLGEEEYARAVRATAEQFQIAPEDIRSVERAVKRFLAHSVEVLSGVEEASNRLPRFTRIMLSKGSAKEQHAKLRRSGLATYFYDVIVVERKDPAYFSQIISTEGVSAEHAIMIGNSVLHDIVPAVAIGVPSVWLNHADNAFGRNAALPSEACENDSWKRIVKALT
jgi:putative hydrolase of the HAD superfamily